MFEKEKQDIMSAEEILDELRKLVESEKSEGEQGSTEDASLLEDAISSIEKFVDAEKGEEGHSTDEMPVSMPMAKPVVDTGILTGPINGLKSFLIRKSADNNAK
jgi:hypothetical protein